MDLHWVHIFGLQTVDKATSSSGIVLDKTSTEPHCSITFMMPGMASSRVTFEMAVSN